MRTILALLAAMIFVWAVPDGHSGPAIISSSGPNSGIVRVPYPALGFCAKNAGVCARRRSAGFERTLDKLSAKDGPLRDEWLKGWHRINDEIL